MARLNLERSSSSSSHSLNSSSHDHLLAVSTPIAETVSAAEGNTTASAQIIDNSIPATENDYAARVFAAALLDPGPDLNSQPSKLWTSRSDFQSGHVVDNPAVVSLDSLVDSFQRLHLTSNGLETQTQTLPPEPSVAAFEPSRNKRSDPKTKKSLHILQNMKRRITASLQTLSLPSDKTLSEAECEIEVIASGLQKINRRKDVVIEQKQEVYAELELLKGQVSLLRRDFPRPSKPVFFDSSESLRLFSSYNILTQHMIGHHYQNIIDDYSAAAQVSIFLGIVCSVIFGVSRRGGDLIMALTRLIIQLVSGKADGSMEPLQKRVLSQVPCSIDAVLSRFKMKDLATTFAVCPVCHCTFPPLTNSGKLKYPERCTNRPQPEGDPCNECLLENDANGRQGAPLKTFLYYPFADYLAGLLSQHESIMDKSCDDCVASLQRPPPTFISSIFEAEFMRTFKGPVPGTLFVKRPGTDGRYLFALSVDYFNIEGLRIRGASTSCGIISLACLNLPIEVRYKPENMYLLIIPGPAEPSLTELNHYLRPLIDDMVNSWDKGIYISRTPKHLGGRNTCSAIALSVNDLPAACQAAALASYSSHFYCSRCECYHVSTRGRTDVDSWKTRDPAKMRRQAEAWRDATTSVEQTKLFQSNGVRWSELWRLPYWDPTQQLVVDTMHCILEGLAKYHSQHVLGLTSAGAAAKLDVPPPFSHPFHPPPDTMNSRDKEHTGQIHSLLTSEIKGGNFIGQVQKNLDKLSENLHRRNLAPLRFVVEDLGLPVRPDPSQKPSVIRKRDYVAALRKWVRSPLLQSDCPKLIRTVIQRESKPLESSNRPVKTSTPEVLQRIREVIRDADTPSWLNSVPHNFGHAAAGKLKADEWRTMFTVYLPIALVSLWGQGTPHSSDDEALKLRAILDHTMDLISAVTIVCLRTMTPRRAKSLRSHLINWVQGLKKLHPHADHWTTGHMALHLYDFIQLFGPVQSWWCFPFERLIGQLQRLPHNHRFGTHLTFNPIYHANINDRPVRAEVA